MMNRLILSLMLIFGFSGCISPIVQDAIDAADEKVRLKWAEEWKPALLAEVKNTISDSKDIAVEEMAIQLDKYRAQTNGKLESIGIKINDFDTNNDGQVAGIETLALLKEIKSKNDENGDPLEWWEIVGALVMGYVPVTAAKEVVKKKLNGTKNGPKAQT